MKNDDGSLAAYQVAESIKDPGTRSRELRALEAAFSELRIESAYVITEHEQETLKLGKNSIPVLPFYRWACTTEPI